MRLSIALLLLLGVVALFASSAVGEDIPRRFIRVRGRKRGVNEGGRVFGRRVARLLQDAVIAPKALYTLPEEREESIATSYLVPAPSAADIEVVQLKEAEVVAAPSSEQLPEQVIDIRAEPSKSYLLPNAAPVEVVEEIQALPSNTYSSQGFRAAPAPLPVVAAASSVRTNTRTEPIAILRSNLNAPGTPGYERTFDYSFESENGIKQEAQGQMKTVGESEVVVMRGSYEYIDNNGETVRVDWYADDTGYHPSSSIIPKPVEIPYPEIEKAVEAQLRFAAEQRAAKLTKSESAVVNSFAESPKHPYE